MVRSTVGQTTVLLQFSIKQAVRHRRALLRCIWQRHALGNAVQGDDEMEPIIEASHQDISAELPQATVGVESTPAGKLAPFTFTRSRLTGRDHPSLKYKEIDEAVNRVTLKHAQSPPKPTLPRRAGIRTWHATAKERDPLQAGLTGSGRAGKYGELLGDNGGRYEGEVLAGRPHGNGRYYASKGVSSGHLLQYEGSWVQGRREGFGTRYYQNGEMYVGEFMANIRHGKGRYCFTNGDVYVGDWVDDRRTGRGTYSYVNGDVFVGNFVRDKKEGMGTLYMLQRQKKMIAEYVNGSPKCGTVLPIEDADLEPLSSQLTTLALHHKLDLASTGRHVSPLPPCQLQQPSKVLGPQVVAVRIARAEQGGPVLAAVQEHSGMLSGRDLEMIRHSFTLMAGGDGPSAGLLPHQLRELAVMAGLDPASSLTRSLVEALLARKDATTGRISYDAALKVALHFRDKDVNDVLDLDPDELLQQYQTGAWNSHGTVAENSTAVWTGAMEAVETEVQQNLPGNGNGMLDQQEPLDNHHDTLVIANNEKQQDPMQPCGLPELTQHNVLNAEFSLAEQTEPQSGDSPALLVTEQPNPLGHNSADIELVNTGYDNSCALERNGSAAEETTNFEQQSETEGYEDGDVDGQQPLQCVDQDMMDNTKPQIDDEQVEPTAENPADELLNESELAADASASPETDETTEYMVVPTDIEQAAQSDTDPDVNGQEEAMQPSEQPVDDGMAPTADEPLQEDSLDNDC